MHIYDRYKFPTAFDAMSARERAIGLGVHRSALQAFQLHMIVDRERVPNLRDVAEVVKQFRGELVEEPSDVTRSESESEFQFESYDRMRQARLDIFRILGCRDETAIELRAENVIVLNREHYHGGRVTPMCPCGEDGVSTSHKSLIREMLAAIEANGGRSAKNFAEWRRSKRRDEDNFLDIERDMDQATSKMPTAGSDLGKLIMVRFPSPAATRSALDHFLRSGIDPRGVVNQLEGLVLIDPDYLNDRSVVEDIAKLVGGRRVQNEEIFGEWIDRGTTGKIEILLSGDEEAKLLFDTLVGDAGVPRDAIERKERTVLLDRSQRDRLLASKDEMKQKKAEVVTKMGRLRIN